MKAWTRRILGMAASSALAAGVVLLSCRAATGTAGTVFAETKSTGSADRADLSGSGVLEAMQNSFRNVSKVILPSVVEVDVTEKKTVQSSPLDSIPWFFFGNPGQERNSKPREYESSGLGSGVIVRRTGNTVYVLTNNHVAGSASTIRVKLYDGREFDAKLVGADERQDIALVSFETADKDISVAALGNSSDVQPGDICFAVGTPLGYFSSITQGIVSATGRSGGQIGNINDFIQTDAAINQGNSGGPLVNIYGEVIGINTWIASQSGGSQGLGFSIPIDNIKNAIDSFISKGKISYGWLGVSLIEINQDEKDSLGVGKVDGAFAGEIFSGSPAAKSGMHAGDFITALNGHAVKDVNQLVRDVGLLRAGEVAEFTVMRGEKKVELSVKIEERTDTVAADNSKLWPGFVAAPVTDSVRKKLNLDKKVEGVVVSNVVEKSPAAALRLQNGDIITAVNDRDVRNMHEFYEALGVNNKEIWFDVYNDGHTISTGHYKIK